MSTFQLCLKDRDLVGGLQFESDSIVRLIIERCMRVIVVLSPEFLASSANNFFVLFAHALSVGKLYCQVVETTTECSFPVRVLIFLYLFT